MHANRRNKDRELANVAITHVNTEHLLFNLASSCTFLLYCTYKINDEKPIQEEKVNP